MANVSCDFKRAFVRRVFRKSVADSISLILTLESLEDARVDDVEGGKVLIATSGNGHQSTFQIPAEFTATDAVELISEITRRYIEAKAKLQDATEDNIANPTDTQIENEIRDKLHPQRSITYDFSGIHTDREEVTT